MRGTSRRADVRAFPDRPLFHDCGLEDLAALLGALGRGARLAPALTLAGVLALARVGGALAGALALAGIGATALHTVGKGGGREGGGRERGSRGNDESTFVHDDPPGGCGTSCPLQDIRTPPGERYARADKFS